MKEGFFNRNILILLMFLRFKLHDLMTFDMLSWHLTFSVDITTTSTTNYCSYFCCYYYCTSSYSITTTTATLAVARDARDSSSTMLLTMLKLYSTFTITTITIVHNNVSPCQKFSKSNRFSVRSTWGPIVSSIFLSQHLTKKRNITYMNEKRKKK